MRRWVPKFGPLIARRLRRRRPPRSKRWHLDYGGVRIAAQRMYRWRAVDEGEILDMLGLVFIKTSLLSTVCPGSALPPMEADTLISRIGSSVPQAVISLHARGPDPQALGSADNDDGLCPKPAYLGAPWTIGKREFETDYCASLPGTAILAFKPRENPVNVG